ncbi:arsenate reductase ArsC [Chloroflexota bacterium]
MKWHGLRILNAMKRVLFICVHNAGRSQMAEAFFNQLAGGRTLATSAGTSPATGINPAVQQAMLELGIDISQQYPQKLTLAMLEEADRAITMGCSEEQTCPASLAPAEDWQLDDPEGQPIEKVREIRDIIKTRVAKLIEELNDTDIQQGKQEVIP